MQTTHRFNDANQENALRLGADDYILKPIKPPLVMARVNAVLRRLGKNVDPAYR